MMLQDIAIFAIGFTLGGAIALVFGRRELERQLVVWAKHVEKLHAELDRR